MKSTFAREFAEMRNAVVSFAKYVPREVVRDLMMSETRLAVLKVTEIDLGQGDVFVHCFFSRILVLNVPLSS